MVRLSGAASGEEVTSAWINKIRRKSDPDLEFLKRRGLSDQKIAAINTILAERSAKVQIPTKEIVKALAEKRTIVPDAQPNLSLANDVKIRQAQTRQQQERPPLTVEPVTKLPGLEGKLQNIRRQQDILRTKKSRQGSLSIKDEAGLSKLAAQQFITELALTPKGIIDFGKAVKENPSLIKKVPSSIKESLKEDAKLIKTDPTTALVKIGGEILLLKGTGKAFKVAGKVTPEVSARLSPRFAGVKNTKIEIPSVKPGKSITLKVVEKIPKETIAKQTSRAGREITGVSAQADRLVNLIKDSKVIRKPIPNEDKLSKVTKDLLKRFDGGKINRRQLVNLDKRIKVETDGQGSLLERSFFADPEARLRKSRLGLKQKDATLLDVLAGDVTFKSPKSQILVFDKVVVEKFPKTEIFKAIKSKLKTGKTLTKKEAEALLRFQLKPTGRFKPLGKLSRESEVIASPKEIIKRKKTLAVTVINGKKIPIVQVELVKASKKASKLLRKVNTGKINSKELRSLKKILKKETGFKTGLSRATVRLPRVSPKRLAASSLISASRRISKLKRARPKIKITPKKQISKISVGRRKKKRKYTTPKKPTRKITVPRKKTPKRTTPKTPKRTVKIVPRRTPRITKRGTPTTTRRPPTTVRSGTPGVPAKLKKMSKKRKVKRKPTKGYNVYARPLRPVRTKKGFKRKLIKINKRPLTKSRAEDVRNYIVDTSLSRTGKIKPAKGKPTRTNLRVPSGYARKSSKKFRTFQQRKGVRKKLTKGSVIEKRRNILDTTPEKRQISLRRRVAQITPKTKQKVRVSSKPAKRLSSKQLNALAMGRAKRMSNLKEKKKKR